MRKKIPAGGNARGNGNLSFRRIGEFSLSAATAVALATGMRVAHGFNAFFQFETEKRERDEHENRSENDVEILMLFHF